MNAPLSQKPDPPTLTDLLRHGEPEGGDRYRGHRDDPLSAEGWRQMRQAVGRERPPWEVVVTSPLRRCADFAREVAKRHALPLEVEPRLMELSFGEWEGRTAADILAVDRERLLAFWKNPLAHPPPGGEDLLSVRQRAAAAWEELVTRHRGRHLLIVTHGGIIRVLVSHVLVMPMEHLSRLLVPYVAFTRLLHEEVEGRSLPRLVFHGAALPEAVPGATPQGV